MGQQVPNQYKEALRSRRSGAAALADSLRTGLDKAQRAMAAGAWQSTVATEFEHQLVARRRTLATAAESVTTEFDDEIARQPDLVDAHSWQAQYYRMSRYAGAG